jgi:hypothetical protein
LTTPRDCAIFLPSKDIFAQGIPMKNRIVIFCLLLALFSGVWAAEKQTGASEQESMKLPVKKARAYIEMGLNLVVTAAYYWINYKDFLKDSAWIRTGW